MAQKTTSATKSRTKNRTSRKKARTKTSSKKKGVLDTLSKKHKKNINDAFSENARKVMQKRYLLERSDGTQETPVDLFARVAGALADVERNYDKTEARVRTIERSFFDLLSSRRYTPAGRTVRNAGAETSLVANCIVLGIPDSMDGIFQTLKDAALLQQAGSGLGFDFSSLRPAMEVTKRTQGTSSGPVEFLKIYDTGFGIIKQQKRHGANMAMMRVDHPDVLDFIRAKKREGDIRNFNISVQLTDEFMRAVTENPDKQWYCTWKGKKRKPQNIIRSGNGSVVDAEDIDITAKELFDEIVDNAWRNGEPGVFFVDEVNRVSNPLPGLGPITCTNPCGEQPLHPNDNCNLGSINLAQFVQSGKVQWAELRKATRTAVRMQDNVIDLFDFPVAQVTELAQKNRRIGLGVMGFADMLYQLKIPYNSKKGTQLAERIMKTINNEAHKMSQKLAKEKGEFPNIELSIYGKKYGKKKVPMRNAALTTIAPTGSISMMLDCSSGIEPQFALAYTKQDKDGERYYYLNQYFKEALEKYGFSKEEIADIKQEAVEKGSIQELENLPQEIKDTFVVSMDISARDHMAMQAAFQKNIDNSISKTINFPNSATHEDIAEGYIEAWKLGCLSCTVYRDGSREVQILNVGDKKDLKAPSDIGKKDEHEEMSESTSVANTQQTVTNGHHPKDRPEVMTGKTYRVRTGYGNLYVTINNDDTGRPFEVFATIGKSGGFFAEQSEGICRMISTALRAGVSVQEIVEQLKGIRGPMPTITERGTVHSLPDALGQILEEHIGLNQKQEPTLFEMEEVENKAVLTSAKTEIEQPTSKKSIADFGYMPGCPDCGSALRMAEGCMSCSSCGFSRCG